MSERHDKVVRPAAKPEGEIACDFEIATELREVGFRERMSAAVLGPVRELPDGVEVRFRPEAWDLVMQYIEVESRCCPFLDLAARRTDDAVVLTVTGRGEAKEAILAIF
jgi:hypothetical protein